MGTESEAARVEFSVGFAYGTDIEQIMMILQNCAKEKPMVLAGTKAKKLFLAFGTSLLDLESVRI